MFMLENDRKRLWRDYTQQQLQSPETDRLGPALGLDLASVQGLGNEIVADLDATRFGIGWWTAYPDLDRKTRILLSDHLIACARAVPTNLIEARIDRLEFDDAAEEFRKWYARGYKPGKAFEVKPPRSPWQELAPGKAQTHLVGMLRAWGSALDCLGSCMVGVAALPTGLVRADSGTAQKALAKISPGVTVLEDLQTALTAAEAKAGPPGWRQWLLDMRNTVVHRGRRTAVWLADADATGVTGFSLQLPVSPEFTDIDAIIRAGGTVASTFTAPASAFFDELARAVEVYTNEVSDVLMDLWNARRTNPALLEQPTEQWKQEQGVINPAPVFGGFPTLPTPPTPVTSLGLGVEADLRLKAAAVTDATTNDVRADPKIWI